MIVFVNFAEVKGINKEHKLKVKFMRKLIVLFILCVLIIASCKKAPGEGGRSHIKGKIWVENYNSLNNIYDTYYLKSEYAGVEKDVYLIFGDDISYGIKTKSGPDGSFQFDFLREGKYKVYVQSKDTLRTSISGFTTMDTTITLGKKDTKDIGPIVIYN